MSEQSDMQRGSGLSYETTPGKLTITADDATREWMAECLSSSDITDITDLLEDLVCNSELNFVDASDTGDLTNAPMLGILNEDGNVIDRWAYMDYQISCPIEVLIDEGSVVFIQ
jgi:hypothetical protein